MDLRASHGVHFADEPAAGGDGAGGGLPASPSGGAKGPMTLSSLSPDPHTYRSSRVATSSRDIYGRSSSPALASTMKHRAPDADFEAEIRSSSSVPHSHAHHHEEAAGAMAALRWPDGPSDNYEPHHPASTAWLNPGEYANSLASSRNQFATSTSPNNGGFGGSRGQRASSALPPTGHTSPSAARLAALAASRSHLHRSSGAQNGTGRRSPSPPPRQRPGSPTGFATTGSVHTNSQSQYYNQQRPQSPSNFRGSVNGGGGSRVGGGTGAGGGGAQAAALASLTSGLKDSCDLHHLPLKIVCIPCDTPICTECHIEDHRGHDYLLVSEAAPQAREWGMEALTDAKEHVAALGTALRTVSTETEKVEAQVAREINSIQVVFEKIVAAVKEIEERCVSSVTAEAKARTSALADAGAELSELLAESEPTVLAISQLLEGGSDYEIVATREPVLERLDAIAQSKRAEDVLRVKGGDLFPAAAECGATGMPDLVAGVSELINAKLDRVATLDRKSRIGAVANNSNASGSGAGAGAGGGSYRGGRGRGAYGRGSLGGGGNGGGGGRGGGKEGSRYFIIKSYTERDIHKSIKYGVWAATESGNRILDDAFRTATGPVYLFFSVNASGKFVGVCQMTSALDYSKMGSWSSLQSSRKGLFSVKWMTIKNIPTPEVMRSIAETAAGDTPLTATNLQELTPVQGSALLNLFAEYESGSAITDNETWGVFDKLESQAEGHAKEQAVRAARRSALSRQVLGNSTSAGGAHGTYGHGQGNRASRRSGRGFAFGASTAGPPSAAVAPSPAPIDMGSRSRARHDSSSAGGGGGGGGGGGRAGDDQRRFRAANDGGNDGESRRSGYGVGGEGGGRGYAGSRQSVRRGGGRRESVDGEARETSGGVRRQAWRERGDGEGPGERRGYSYRRGGAGPGAGAGAAAGGRDGEYENERGGRGGGAPTSRAASTLDAVADLRERLRRNGTLPAGSGEGGGDGALY